MQRELVLFGINRNRADIEFRRGAKDADRNFGAVGDEYTVDGSHWLSKIIGQCELGSLSDGTFLVAKRTAQIYRAHTAPQVSRLPPCVPDPCIGCI